MTQVDSVHREDPTAGFTSREPHPDLPVIGHLAGRWSWSLVEDRWWWSDEVYVIHGFRSGEVVPTLELVMSHKHPDDLEKCRALLATAIDIGYRFSHYHRILDAHGRERRLLVVGEGHSDDQGCVVGLSGYMIDLTKARRDDLEPAIREAIDNVLSARGRIEQTKGAIMLARGVDADTAFALLHQASCSNNRKIRDVAAAVVDQLNSNTSVADDLVTDLLTSTT